MNTSSSTSMGKTLAIALAALLVGLVIGNSNMKADLRHARDEIASLKKDLAKRGGGSTGMSGITSMLRIPEPVKEESGARRWHGRKAQTNVVAKLEPATSPSNTVVTEVRTNRAVSMQDQLKTATDLWKTRCELARNSFISNVATSDEQAIQFDVAMAAMNLRLSNSIRTWVEYVKTETNMSPEAGIKILNDLSGDLVWAYKDLDRSMPQNWRAQAGEKFGVFDFIDPAVAQPLLEVEDRLKAPRGAPGGSEPKPEDNIELKKEISFEVGSP